MDVRAEMHSSSRASVLVYVGVTEFELVAPVSTAMLPRVLGLDFGGLRTCVSSPAQAVMIRLIKSFDKMKSALNNVL